MIAPNAALNASPPVVALYPFVPAEGDQVHSVRRLAEVNAVIHSAADGMAKLMDKDVSHAQWICHCGRDQDLHAFVGTGGVGPTFADCTTALGAGRETTGDAHLCGNGAGICPE